MSSSPLSSRVIDYVKHKKYRVIVEAADIKGKCPIYKQHDKIVIDPFDDSYLSVVNLKETDAICTRLLGSGLLSYFMLYEKAADEMIDFGATKGLVDQEGVLLLKCSEVGEPYTENGYVIFKIYRKPIE